MTTHFIDITLRPDPEFSDAHLLGALMSKLHRALVQLRADDIGVSFPDYSLRPRSMGRTSGASIRSVAAPSNGPNTSWLAVIGK